MRFTRMNFEVSDDGVFGCIYDHDKSEGCCYEKLTPQEIFDLLEGAKKEILKLESQLSIYTTPELLEE